MLMEVFKIAFGVPAALPSIANANLEEGRGEGCSPFSAKSPVILPSHFPGFPGFHSA